tara:strand:+ start:587 stop:1282 length:696 start_codon:yes stop_codon:yes gene_type:complete
MKTKWKKIEHSRQRLTGEKLTLRDGGLTWGANFIRNNDLIEKKAVSFFISEEDPYKLGFQFLDKQTQGSSKLVGQLHPSNTATRQCNCKALINNSKLLSRIKESENREDRIFSIKKEEDIFYIQMNPCFEYSIQFSEIRTLDKSIKGIYRCLDSNENVVYIGSGRIHDEALAAQKKCETQFKYIEYSMIADRDAAFDWERYHQLEHKKIYGDLPYYNKVLAPNKNVIEINN